MANAGKYSFLIAFADQLEAALTRDHGIDRVTDAVESLRASLEGIFGSDHVAAGEDAGDDDDGIDAEDDDGWGPPLGGPLPSPDAVGRPPDVVLRRIGAGDTTPAAGAGVVLGSKRQRASLLKKGGKRRGKK